MTSRRARRSSFWSAVFLVLLFVCGFMAVGYWQTYDMPCDYGREWVMTTFPPRYICRAG